MAPRQFYGYPGIGQQSLKASTNSVGWEGRGVAIGTASLGVQIGDYSVGTKKTACTQLRLNADGVHYAASTACNL